MLTSATFDATADIELLGAGGAAVADDDDADAGSFFLRKSENMCVGVGVGVGVGVLCVLLYVMLCVRFGQLQIGVFEVWRWAPQKTPNKRNRFNNIPKV